MVDILRDRQIAWQRKREYIANTQFNGIVTNADGSIYAGAGDVVAATISNSGLSGARLEATTDIICDFRPVPADCDVTYPIYFRVYWSSESSTGADTATLRIRYGAIADQEVMAAPATALSTAITVDTLGGQYYLCRTAWGTLDADSLVDGDFLGIEVMCTATDATIASEYIFVLGYEMEYTPKRTVGGGCCQEAETPNSA